MAVFCGWLLASAYLRRQPGSILKQYRAAATPQVCPELLRLFWRQPDTAIIQQYNPDQAAPYSKPPRATTMLP
jgi:hypothetical protein